LHGEGGSAFLLKPGPGKRDNLIPHGKPTPDF
jgi:hypothetical protein